MILHVRPIPSCPGYFVSDTGRVWGPRKELSLSNRGYPEFSPHVAGRHQTVAVAHAVAEAFLGPKPLGAFVCHRNDNRQDNHPENLYYGDAHTNNLDTYRNGGRSAKGEAHPQTSLTWKEVAEIRRRYSAGGVTQAQLGKEYGVQQPAISRIVQQRRWREPEPKDGNDEQ